MPIEDKRHTMTSRKRRGRRGEPTTVKAELDVNRDSHELQSKMRGGSSWSQPLDVYQRSLYGCFLRSMSTYRERGGRFWFSSRHSLHLHNKTVDAAARALLSLLCSVLREASRFKRRELHRLRRRIRGSINFATSNRTVRAAGVVRTAVYLIEKAMLHGNREAYAYTIGGRVEAMRSSLLRHSTFISLTASPLVRLVRAERERQKWRISWY